MPKAIELQRDEMLEELNKRNSIEDKFTFLHNVARKQFDFIHRVGVAVHDPRSDCLKTFARITDGDNPVPQYQYSLSETQSLYRTIPDGRPQAINDRLTLDSSDENCQRLLEHGFRSSYTIPIYQNAKLAGFVFFDSRMPGVFRADVLPCLDTLAPQFSLLVSPEQS
jgi:GAF domain-containing protein